MLLFSKHISWYFPIIYYVLILINSMEMFKDIREQD